MLNRMSWFVLVLSLVSLPALADDEMKKVAWLAGDWDGDAWIQMGPGKRETAVQHEQVQWKLGGKVLMIDGVGKRKNADDTIGEVVHEALGVISWDAQKKAYRFDAWTARDGYVAAWMTVTDNNTATWGFDTPGGGKIRYTIKLTEKGEWNEIGEFSRDGNSYVKFFEMTLTKKK
jgi:hypothetical protein